MGGKRTLLRMALQALHGAAPAPRDHVPLPEGAPFGRVVVDVAGCTLCLACVGACPTGALVDNPERPQLAFIEDACVQCGLCRSTCPERVIALEPRLNFTDEARQPLVIKQEEPFECIRCGKPFGTRSSIEKIVEKLAAKHSMFMDSAAVDRIRMCDDCRVIVQFEVTDNPLAAGPRPKTRTTDDYLREREEIEAARAKVKAGSGGGWRRDTSSAGTFVNRSLGPDHFHRPRPRRSRCRSHGSAVLQLATGATSRCRRRASTTAYDLTPLRYRDQPRHVPARHR